MKTSRTNTIWRPWSSVILCFVENQQSPLKRFSGNESIKFVGKILLLFHQKTALCCMLILSCLDQSEKRWVSEIYVQNPFEAGNQSAFSNFAPYVIRVLMITIYTKQSSKKKFSTRENVIIWLTFKPGFALTVFQTIQPHINSWSSAIVTWLKR